jgi:hypothetical protein
VDCVILSRLCSDIGGVCKSAVFDVGGSVSRLYSDIGGVCKSAVFDVGGSVSRLCSDIRGVCKSAVFDVGGVCKSAVLVVIVHGVGTAKQVEGWGDFTKSLQQMFECLFVDTATHVYALSLCWLLCSRPFLDRWKVSNITNMRFARTTSETSS